MTALEIEAKYKVKSYRRWDQVPDYLYTRTALKKEGIIVPKDQKPDGIKNASSTLSSKRNLLYFLFDKRKFQTS